MPLKPKRLMRSSCPPTRPLSERVALIEIEARKQRSASMVEKDIAKTIRALQSKQTEINQLRFALLTTFSGQIRALRQSRVQKLAAEIEALKQTRKALRKELPIAKRADAVKKELGIDTKQAKRKPSSKRKSAKKSSGIRDSGARTALDVLTSL